MQLGTRTRLVLGAIVLLASVGYLIVVDLGIHAGRIHRGVGLEGGVSVGGLTLTEAVDKLEEVERGLENDPLVFVAEGFDCRFIPAELGFDARPFSTARRAMRVGREDAPLGAIADRLRAWFGGVMVEWVGSPDPRKVTTFVRDCEELGASFGTDVNRGQLRFRMKKAFVEWPRRQIHQIPLE